jgi:tRNA1Val (adenine37-N6)-methyltransferase
MSVFQFKQFAVKQSDSAMKVGTDSVLLGSLLETPSPKSILDIGTGTGVLALMMAQRFPELMIDAVEIDKEAAFEARYNFQESQWRKNLNVFEESFQSFINRGQTYDLIVSNPPYYHYEDNYKIETEQRSKARHTETLSFNDLVKGVSTLLTDEGCCWMVLPKAESEDLIAVAKTVGLFLNAQIHIAPKRSKPFNRVVFQLSKKEQPVHEQNFFIYEEDGKYTKEYFISTQPFLLWNKSV